MPTLLAFRGQFLLEAARFIDGGCPLCVIANTSLMLAAGAGAEALFAPEMVTFAPAASRWKIAGRRAGVNAHAVVCKSERDLNPLCI
jgi:hypothetical protein